MKGYNMIGLDPSLISTAVCIITDEKEPILMNWCREKDAEGKKGLYKWFSMAEEKTSYHYVDYGVWDGYSMGEITKLTDYDKITDSIIDVILTIIDPGLPTKIAIEGYSYASSAGDIIDLVTFSTLLRNKLYKSISTDMTVLAPSTLKLTACKMAYDPVMKMVGKKKPKAVFEHRNPFGIPGGSFTKTDILMSIIEGPYEDRWSNLLRQLSGDFTELSKVPKPFEDLNDSYIACQSLFRKEKGPDLTT